MTVNESNRLVTESIAAVESDLSEQDRSDVREYHVHGEYGVAYELLAFVLDKTQVAHPTALIEGGRKMVIGRGRKRELSSWYRWQLFLCILVARTLHGLRSK